MDKVIKLGYNRPQGPLELAYLIGLDAVLYASEAIYKEIGDPKYSPPIILKHMVKAVLNGRKTGKGFYKY
jgi:3-hydroxybutyryl-CoA dehydrogenase